MKIIGITGPSGAGKTTLTKILCENYNSYTIDADQVAKALSNDNKSEYFKKIVNLFGKEILKEDGKLNRKKIATIIYNDKDKRKALNKLTFEYVVNAINDKISEIKPNDYDYIGIDVPLLYEAKMEMLCDIVIAVVAEDEEKISRICKRDNISRELVLQRLKIQNSNEFFAKKADFVVHNSGSLTDLEKSLKEIIEKI